MATAYDVSITGTTVAGPFSRTGLLVVEPPLDTSGVNFNNGVNARDVGLFSGNPPTTPEIGSIWFATNTSVFDQVGIDTNIDLALIDVAIVVANEQAGILSVTIDGAFFGLPAARTSLLNCMNARSGLTANVYQLIQGSMQLQFADGGQTVSGEINFVGNGYIEPGTSPYQATLRGIRQVS